MKQPPAQPRAAFSTAVDLDTEEGRAFLQERLAFFSKVGFFLTSGFYCVGYLSFLLALPVADFLRGFGLVRDLEAARDASLTGLNTMAGTPLYLAPRPSPIPTRWTRAATSMPWARSATSCSRAAPSSRERR